MIDLRYFKEARRIDKSTLEISDGLKALATSIGEVTIQVREPQIQLNNIFYVPKLHLNVFPCSRLVEKGMTTKIARAWCTFYYINHSCYNVGCIHGNRKGRLYRVPIIIPPHNRRTVVAALRSDRTPKKQITVNESRTEQLWDKRMGHINSKAIKVMISKGIYGMNEHDCIKKKNCSSHVYSK